MLSWALGSSSFPADWNSWIGIRQRYESSALWWRPAADTRRSTQANFVFLMICWGVHWFLNDLPFMFHCLFLSHVASVLMPDSIPCCTTLWRFDSDLLKSKAEFLHVHRNITTAGLVLRGHAGNTFLLVSWLTSAVVSWVPLSFKSCLWWATKASKFLLLTKILQ